MIIILDYDMGNVASIQNMLKYLGENDVYISKDISMVRKADKLILPGVGSFDAGMENLEKYQLIDEIKRHVKLKKQILGICLGMQLLGNRSEEGRRPGLGLIDFETKRFHLKQACFKVPHMGWDYVMIKNQEDKLVRNFPKEARFYFVHSYYAVCANSENILMTCDYGIEFCASVFAQNIYGVQFHPEKSHKFGMKLLENFLKL